MVSPQDDNKVYVFPYGRYVGKDAASNKTYIQISGEEYTEIDTKWDGILKAIATVPTLTQFKETLVKAGVKDVDEYVDSLIAGEMLTLVDSGENVLNSVGNLYEWALVPTCKYEGESSMPSLNKLKQANITTEDNPLPFTISNLALQVLGDTNQRIIGMILPNVIREKAAVTGMSEKELYSVFVNDARKLVQHKAAFFA